MNSKETGIIGEHYFLFLCSLYGITVLEPRGDIKPYDFVIELNNRFYKIQVKTSNRSKNGATTFNIGKTCGYKKLVNYIKEDCDYFFLYDLKNNKYALINFDDIKNKSYQISLRHDKPKINQKNIRYFDDYSIDIFIGKNMLT